MTNNNPTSGNAPALLDESSPEKIKARIAQFCEWFDQTPPKLKVQKGEVMMNDVFLQWFKDTGASMDWIICGDVKLMAGFYRLRSFKE